MLIISVGFVGLKKSDEEFGSGRNFVKSALCPSNLLARLGPRFTKYELNVLGVSSVLMSVD